MKKLVVLLVTIAAVILIGNVLIASAQNGSNPNWPPMGPGMMNGNDTGPPIGMMRGYTGTMPMGGGMMGWGNHTQMYNAMTAAGGMHQQVMTAVATQLGMTYDQLTAALQNGQTIAQLAAARGVSLETLQQAANTARTDSINALVEQGIITREQADWMISHMQNMPMFGFSNNGSAPYGFGPGPMGRGRMGRGTQPTGPQG